MLEGYRAWALRTLLRRIARSRGKQVEVTVALLHERTPETPIKPLEQRLRVNEVVVRGAVVAADVPTPPQHEVDLGKVFIGDDRFERLEGTSVTTRPFVGRPSIFNFEPRANQRPGTLAFRTDSRHAREHAGDTTRSCAVRTLGQC